MSTVQPVSGCNLARQMQQAKKSPGNLKRMDEWTIFTRKTKQIGVVKHRENKHRKYDERDEAEASRTKQDKPKALQSSSSWVEELSVPRMNRSIIPGVIQFFKRKRMQLMKLRCLHVC